MNGLESTPNFDNTIKRATRPTNMVSRKKLFALVVFYLAAALVSMGQTVPRRIVFTGSRGAVSGSLSNGHEANYIFSAEKGQNVTIRNSRTSQFDFRVYSEEFGLETEFESSAALSFNIPETGDYLFFVRKKMASPRMSKYSISITIK